MSPLFNILDSVLLFGFLEYINALPLSIILTPKHKLCAFCIILSKGAFYILAFSIKLIIY